MQTTRDTPRNLVVFGTGGHAVSVAETAQACGYRVTAFVEDAPRASELLGRPVLDRIPDDPSIVDAVVVAVGSNVGRASVWRRLHESPAAYDFPALVHPSASVAAGAMVGAGAVVMQGAIVGNLARVGTGCIVNSGAIVEHECVLEPFSSLGPRAVIGGRVSIGERSAIAIGAVVREWVAIGSDSVLGAAALALQDLPANVVAYGVPARVVRARAASDPYLRS